MQPLLATIICYFSPICKCNVHLLLGLSRFPDSLRLWIFQVWEIDIYRSKPVSVQRFFILKGLTPNRKQFSLKMLAKEWFSDTGLSGQQSKPLEILRFQLFWCRSWAQMLYAGYLYLNSHEHLWADLIHFQEFDHSKSFSDSVWIYTLFLIIDPWNTVRKFYGTVFLHHFFRILLGLTHPLKIFLLYRLHPFNQNKFLSEKISNRNVK